MAQTITWHTTSNAGEEIINARYVREDNKVAVFGRWIHRGGCLYLGEIRILTGSTQHRFSSTTPRTDLSDHATEEYLARHASKFIARTDGYL